MPVKDWFARPVLHVKDVSSIKSLTPSASLPTQSGGQAARAVGINGRIESADNYVHVLG
jgi:hypothetical protein